MIGSIRPVIPGVNEHPRGAVGLVVPHISLIPARQTHAIIMNATLKMPPLAAGDSGDAAIIARIAALGSALEREPSRPDLAVALAEALRGQGRVAEAAELLALALALKPDLAATHLALGNLARTKGDALSALDAYERAAAFAPDAIEPLGNRALALKDLGRLDEAIQTLESALARAPENVELIYNLGNCRYAAGDLDGAARNFHAVLARAPDHGRARINLGLIHRDQGRVDEAVVCFDRVIAHEPGNPTAHWNRAMALLLGGDFKRGWPEYEWRWRATDMRPRQFSAPLWDGKPLEGRTILLHAEQGLGDSIQFVRYVPMVVAQGGRVILEVQPPLMRLLGAMKGPAQVIKQGDPLPAFDCHIPLMSLPALFGATLENILASVPYLAPPGTGKNALAAVFAGRATAKRIGVVWGGNPGHQADATRSCRAGDLKPLAVPGVAQLYSLQKGSPYAEQVVDLPGAIDLGPLLDDMADTAYAISQLDLVITIDSAVAHLAGALGKPVWTMIAFVPDWRQMLHRADSPWYPTMRLYRQTQPGDWVGVVARIRDAIASGLL